MYLFSSTTALIFAVSNSDKCLYKSLRSIAASKISVVTISSDISSSSSSDCFGAAGALITSFIDILIEECCICDRLALRYLSELLRYNFGCSSSSSLSILSFVSCNIELVVFVDNLRRRFAGVWEESSSSFFLVFNFFFLTREDIDCNSLISTSSNARKIDAIVSLLFAPDDTISSTNRRAFATSSFLASIVCSWLLCLLCFERRINKRLMSWQSNFVV